MKTNNNTHSLRDVILQNMNDKGLTRPQLVQAMGYINITKGLRRLEYYLATLEAPNDQFVIQLLRILEINGLLFHRSLMNSLSIIQMEAEKTFKPYLLIDIDFQPRPMVCGPDPSAAAHHPRRCRYSEYAV